jgi:toxin ParE1/3/4
LGASFLLCVDAVFHGIVRDPQRWPRIHREARRALTRRFPYEVFFVEDKERVVVLSVFHAKRNPKSWQERV